MVMQYLLVVVLIVVVYNLAHLIKSTHTPSRTRSERVSKVQKSTRAVEVGKHREC